MTTSATGPAQFTFETPAGAGVTAPFLAAILARVADFRAERARRRQEQKILAVVERLESLSPHLVLDIGFYDED